MNVVFSAVNGVQKFTDQMRVLLLSLYKNSPNTKVVIDLIDVKKSFAYDCRRIHPKAIVRTKELGSEYKVKNNKSSYMDIHRARMLHEWDEEGCMMWLDSDIIIRKPLDEFWSDVEPGSIKIWKKEGKTNPATIFNNGVMAFGINDLTRDFCRDYLRLMERSQLEWPVSQRAFWYTYQMYKKSIKLVPLDPKEYNDRRFGDSHIWHPTQVYINHPLWKEEFNRLFRDTLQIKFI